MIEILDLGRNQDLEVFHWKAFKLAHTTFGLADAFPKFWDRLTDGRNSPHAGHDDAARTVSFGHNIFFHV